MVIGIRIAPDNRELLAAAAAKSGERLSSWARGVLVDIARKSLTPSQPDISDKIITVRGDDGDN